MRVATQVTALFLVALFLAVPPAAAQDPVKIGFLSTLSGGSGIIGQHEKDGAELALDDMDRRMAGREVRIIYGDDELKPDIARQRTEEMLKKDKVDFMAGMVWSNVLLAVYQPIIQSKTILVSASAGPHEIAGAMCSPYFFSTAKQNDEPPEAMGQYLTDRKLDDVYLMAPNFAAGKDMITGFKRFYKGRIAGEVYTRLDQTDYQTELTRIRTVNPKGVFVFYAGGMGIQFFKQYDQAGLHGVIPLYSAASQDETVLPAIGAAAEGNHEAGIWSPDLKNPANTRFVAEFRKKYGHIPSIYAAEAYDAINLIASGVNAVKGGIGDKAKVIAAMEKADFPSVRGPFKFNTNHFPIQNVYVFRIEKDADGTYISKVETLVMPDHKDAYYEECGMK